MGQIIGLDDIMKAVSLFPDLFAKTLVTSLAGIYQHTLQYDTAKEGEVDVVCHQGLVVSRSFLRHF